MSQLPERYQAAIAPLIDKAREFLEQGEELAAMAFVGNFTTGAVVPTPLFGRGPADKDVAARSVKLLAEQLDADFVFLLMEAYSLRADKVARYEEILDEYGSLADCPASWRIDVVSLSLETRHGVWVAQVPVRPKGISKKRRTIGAPEFRHYTEVQGRLMHEGAGDGDALLLAAGKFGRRVMFPSGQANHCQGFTRGGVAVPGVFAAIE